MTNEELRNTDAYKLVHETYMYALQKEFESVDGDATKINVGTISQTVAKIVSTPQAAEILNKLSTNETSTIVGLVVSDICTPREDPQN